MAKTMARDAPSTDAIPLTAHAHATSPSWEARLRRPNGKGRPMRVPGAATRMREAAARIEKGRDISP
jgi:hypothetical protein